MIRLILSLILISILPAQDSKLKITILDLDGDQVKENDFIEVVE
tara:strand:- start:280 stop:411 length:132 start_codon:yes stop_codon:yes gene_type:complete